MNEVPVPGVMAEYRGSRYRILFRKPGWVALRVDQNVDIPDAIARGERRWEPSGVEQWAKVPTSTVDGEIEVRVRGSVRGQAVSVQGQLSDGRVRVSFVGSPAAAEELGLEGDQHMGWIGLFQPCDIHDVQVEEKRRA